jgi:type II secretory pathway pseudopilin PulG
MYMKNQRRRLSEGLTLIELIGVLAILAIFAALLIPSAVRQLDQVAGDQETAALKALSDAFQRGVLRHRYIPSQADWANFVATELGVAPQNVTTNGRQQPRYFLIDPALRIGTNSTGLPFGQSNWIAGSMVKFGSNTIAPLSPRTILVSSVGIPLTNAVSGVPSSADFNALWNSTNSLGTPFAYAREDLRIQRMDLSSLFVRVVLTTNDCSTNSGHYSVSINALESRTNLVPANPWIDGYFISGTVLGLYATNGTWFDSSQIIGRDSSFIYDGSVWRNALLGPAAGAGGASLGIFPSAYSIVTNFLASPSNSAAGAVSQYAVVQAMIDYMKAYDAWAASATFPNNNSNHTFAVQMYDNMVSNVNRLCCSPIPPERP